jgi:cholest-4-en-3-one 26-monooxygenase
MEFDLTDPECFAKQDPHPVFKRMRAEDPIQWTTGRISRGFWSITRYEDALTVYRDAETFSSQRYSVGLPSNPEAEQMLSPEMRGCGQMLIGTDPPRHNAMRRRFNGSFLPRAIARLESSSRPIVSEIIDAVAPRGQCDFVVEVAARLPMAIICEMMAIPRADWESIFKWANMVIGGEDPEYQVGGSALNTSMEGGMQLFMYCLNLAKNRRDTPGGDLLSVIGTAKLDGILLNDMEIGHNAVMFVLGGLETTRNAISGGVLELMRNPDQWKRLAQTPALMPTAIEEILRWTTPITHIMRTATRDFEWRGRQIRDDDWIAIWNVSANRDEEAFADPYRFDITRNPNYHLAFGQGEHFCIGSHLARLELRLMLEEVMRRMPDLRLAGEVERLKSFQVAGIKHMPVAFTPSKAAAA